MNGTEMLQPVQWMLAPLKPLLFWSGVQEAWLMATALNCIVMVTGIAKALSWGGENGGDWKLVACAAGLAAAYGCAQYLPSGLTAISGAALVFTFSAVALKLSGLLGKGGAHVIEKIKPKGEFNRGPDKIDGT
jgi:hypothetical protein